MASSLLSRTEDVIRGFLRNPKEADEKLKKVKHIEPTKNKEIKEYILSSESENESKIDEIFSNIDEGDSNNFDVNFKYDNKRYMEDTLMHLAAAKKKPKMLQRLLTHNPDVSAVNKKGDTSIISTLKACLKCDESGPSTSGNSARKSMVTKVKLCEGHIACLDILVRCKADLHIKNRKGLSAVSYASMFDSEKRAKYLSILFGKDYENTLKETDRLYSRLNDADDNRFEEAMDQYKENIASADLSEFMWTDGTNTYTFLQIVCKLGMVNSARYLISLGAATDHIPYVLFYPINLACYHSHPELLEYLISIGAHLSPETRQLIRTKSNKILIHIAVLNVTNSKSAVECLKILLRNQDKVGTVNDQDDDGRTALHYATISGDDKCIVELLENGASQMVEDKWKDTPLTHMPVSAYEKYLNNMITIGKKNEVVNEEILTDDNRENQSLLFDFEKFLIKRKAVEKNKNENKWKFFQSVREKWSWLKKYKKDSTASMISSTNEEFYALPTDLLQEIKKIKKLRVLFAHPILSTIIYFKWLKIRFVFLASQILHLLFTIVYTVYLVTNEGKTLKFTPKMTLLAALIESKPKFSLPVIDSDYSLYGVKFFLLTIVSILLAAFVLIESFKIFYQKFAYFRDLHNCIRFLGVVLAGATVILPDPYLTADIRAISILLLWLDFAFTVGKYPDLALYISIFREAMSRLLQFLIVYSGIIIGFSLSFHFLFQTEEGVGDYYYKPEKNRTILGKSDFSNPLDAFFLTLGMISGEFGAEDLPFNNHPWTSHFIFTLYICVTTLILVNIISEMISQVKIISGKPILYKMLAQVDVFQHYENNYTKNKLIQAFDKFKPQRIFGRKENHGKGKNFIFKIILNGEKKELKHRIVFETYPEEKIFVEPVEDDNKPIIDGFGIFGFSGLDNQVIEKAKKIVKEKLHKDEKKDKESELNSLKISLRKEINELQDVRKKFSEEIELLKELRQGRIRDAV